MAQKAPSEHWYAEKDGTPVRRFWTPGETRIDLPEAVDAVESDSDELKQLDIDESVLNEVEKKHLGL